MYNTCRSCGCDCCLFEANANEPCWGKVEAVEEVEIGNGDFGWIHACDGHAQSWDGFGPYKPEPETPTVAHGGDN